jgi:tRNA A37 methylthiotransferase MiaB
MQESCFVAETFAPGSLLIICVSNQHSVIPLETEPSTASKRALVSSAVECLLSNYVHDAHKHTIALQEAGENVCVYCVIPHRRESESSDNYAKLHSVI